jgi:serine/threonine-protein kinase HipA
MCPSAKLLVRRSALSHCTRSATGNIAKQFRLLAAYAGIQEKQTNATMALMVSKTEQVTNLIDASFLKDRIKQSYLQGYQLKLKKLGE